MDNNDDFSSLGLEGVTLQQDAAPAQQPTDSATATPSQQPQNATDDGILNDLSNEETIDLFIEGIMEEKGIDAPTEEIKQDIKQNLKNQLLQQIDRSLIAELPDDKLEELNRMAATDKQIDPTIVARMIEEAHLNITDIVGVTMARFREIYLGKNPTEPAEE